MSDWIDLPPRSRLSREAVVTLALAVPASGSAALRVNISRSIGEAIGLGPKQRVACSYSQDGRRLRLTHTEGTGYTVGARDTTLTLTFRLPWLDKEKTAHAAESSPYRVEGDALIIDLPAWARQPTSIAAPISAAEATAEAKREALAMIGQGRSVRYVAEIVGESPETVRAWREEAQARQRTAA